MARSFGQLWCYSLCNCTFSCSTQLLWMVDLDLVHSAGQRCKSLDQYTPFPALSSVKCSDIKFFRSWELPMKRAAKVFSNVCKAQCVLFTSFCELEACAIDAISQVVPYPIYAVGPSIPNMALEGGPYKIHHEEYINWLDDQPKKFSVVCLIWQPCFIIILTVG